MCFLLYQRSVRLFKRRKAAYIQRLKLMGRMSRHVDRNYIIFTADLIKLRRKMAAMAIKN
jgi:hypothetical protein